MIYLITPVDHGRDEITFKNYKNRFIRELSLKRQFCVSLQTITGVSAAISS